MELKEKVKNLPASPGVYLMKDSLGSIIYVGKSKSLKNRVQSYFQNSKAHSPKVEKLRKNLKDFEYILTDTEFEAFLLECKLIRDLKPIYNKLMKSPLSYTYIRIKMDEEFPGIEIINNPGDNDCSIYFGPYTNKNTVERAVQGIKECCKIICSNPSKKSTACLNYSLGLCIGMCQGRAAVEQHRSIINKIITLLNRTDRSILEEMEQRMVCASENFDFETAAKYRDYIGAVNFLINKEKVIEFTEENKNIVIIEKLDSNMVKLFLIKSNKVLLNGKYTLDNQNNEHLRTMIKANILVCFRNAMLHPSPAVSRDEIDEAQIIYSYLKGSTCSYAVIPEEWLDSHNNSGIDEALHKLLPSGV